MVGARDGMGLANGSRVKMDDDVEDRLLCRRLTRTRWIIFPVSRIGLESSKYLACKDLLVVSCFPKRQFAKKKTMQSLSPRKYCPKTSITRPLFLAPPRHPKQNVKDALLHRRRSRRPGSLRRRRRPRFGLAL